MLTFYAECLRGANDTLDAALDRVREMAANCYPKPYPSDPNDTPVENIVSGVYSGAFIKKRGHDKLCKLLGISADLADELHLETLIPDELRARRKAETMTRDNYTQMRRDAMLDLVGKYGLRPPVRMANILSAQDRSGARNPVNGKAWSHEIIRQDYIALNFTRRPIGLPTNGEK